MTKAQIDSESVGHFVTKQIATVWFCPTARRRFLTKNAAIRAEARALINKKHPKEAEERDEIGRTTYSGWYWTDMKRSNVLFRRVCRLVRNSMQNYGEQIARQTENIVKERWKK